MNRSHVLMLLSTIALAACSASPPTDGVDLAEPSGGTTTTPRAWATPCPETLTYPNGTLLKDGNAWLYPSGASFVARKGGKWSVRYDNGGILSDGTGYFFYPSGMLMQDPSGDVLHYPDGRPLRTFVTSATGTVTEFRYPSGALLRTDGKVFYENGQVAVSDEDFFAPDGTPTTPSAFFQGFSGPDDPYKISVPVGVFGTLFGPTPGPASNAWWFQMYTRIDPINWTNAVPQGPRVSLHYLENNYVPRVTAYWSFQNTRVSLDLYNGAGPVSCTLTIETP